MGSSSAWRPRPSSATPTAACASCDYRAASSRKGEYMRVCVVGGTGNISTGIVKALLGFGHEVTVFTRGQRESRLPFGVRYLTGDRKDRATFEAAMQAERFDAAIDMISFTEEDAAS